MVFTFTTDKTPRWSAYRSMAIATMLVAISTSLHAGELTFEPSMRLSVDEAVSIAAPAAGLWSIGAGWKNDAPNVFTYGGPTKIETAGGWTVLSGAVETVDGLWKIQDQYKQMGDSLVQAKRRWEYNGEQPSGPVVLTFDFQVGRGADQPPLRTFLPGINYFGNPSGTHIDPNRVPTWSSKPGAVALYEEHRYPMPFASVESDRGENKVGFVAALHSRPSKLPYGARDDLWWSLGLFENETGTRVSLQSGPVASNGKRGFVKARQTSFLPYPNAHLIGIPPGAVIEKEFYLQLAANDSRGHGFATPLWTSIDFFDPRVDRSMTRIKEVIGAKLRDTFARWRQDDHCSGFRTRPPQAQAWFMLGWADCAEAAGHALMALDLKPFTDTPGVWKKRGMDSLDFLITTPSLGQKKHADFSIVYDYKQHRWLKRQNPLSQAQALNSLADSLSVARRGDAGQQALASRLSEFLTAKLLLLANHVLEPSWRPVSTNEAFAIAPLVKGSELLQMPRLMMAARKLADHTIERHLDMTEPYWGGTLDARCEDKEGAWAAFQGFVEMYRVTKDKKYLPAAIHAADVCLSYLYVWDVSLPPGRLTDHRLKTRGWTSVSVQNQHLDAFGVVFTPQLWQLGLWTGDARYQELARLMLVSAGQLTDLPTGIQGEQLFQTNYQQHGTGDTVEGMRGGYCEEWNMYWISAHFLTAVAGLERLGVEWEDF